MNIGFVKKSLLKKIIKILLTLFIAILSLFTILVILSMTMFPWARPDFYYKLKYEWKIKNDDRIEKLISFERTVDFWDKNIFHIGLELKGGGKILFRARQSFDDIQGIIEIGNYRIWALELDIAAHNLYVNSDGGIFYTDGLPCFILEVLLNKPETYFWSFDNYLICYDEIKLIMEKINIEKRLPGEKEDRGRYDRKEGEKAIWIGNIEKWGDEEELKNYTGYIILTEVNRAKVYVDIIEDE